VIAEGPQQAGLTALTAVARSTLGAHDCSTLLARICESVAESLGFDRVTLTRYSADDGYIELLAAHGVPLHDPTGRIGADGWHLFRRACATGSPALAQNRSPARSGVPTLNDAEGAGAVVVVPLFSGTNCVGFLGAAQGDTPLELEASQHELLATLGTIVAAFLEKAIVHDDLMNALRLRSEFIALASHELRTPAAAVCAAATTLNARSRTLRLEQQSEVLRLLDEQAERLRALVDQLLDLSRLDATSVRITPVALAVRERTEEIVRGVATEHGGDIEIRIDPTLRVPADPEAFDRIVSNLIANAVRYGRPPITVSAAASDRHFRLAVEDRGRGVAREYAPRLFERFSRAAGSAKPGAGLGLSIAQAYAHAHGGQLAYTDAKPHGARFELVVPVHSPPPAAPQSLGKTGAPIFRAGQTVWLNGRAASFCYAMESASAVIRYDGESQTRVVSLHKLASASPSSD
jgi:signal transduction histidine kinase